MYVVTDYIVYELYLKSQEKKQNNETKQIQDIDKIKTINYNEKEH